VLFIEGKILSAQVRDDTFLMHVSGSFKIESTHGAEAQTDKPVDLSFKIPLRYFRKASIRYTMHYKSKPHTLKDLFLSMDDSQKDDSYIKAFLSYNIEAQEDNIITIMTHLLSGFLSEPKDRKG
jgi:hypothetical protein